ncbi:putative small nuclear ribonucleoprotein G, partial [Baffinella frigidus]
KILLEDTRILCGKIIVCDNHMNTILAYSKEIRKNEISCKWESRKLGLCIIRGKCIISIS